MGGRTWGIDASPRGGYAPACKSREAPARASVAHSWRRKWYYVHVTRHNNPSIHQHLNTGVEQGEQGTSAAAPSTFGAGEQCSASPKVCRCDRLSVMIIYRWKSPLTSIRLFLLCTKLTKLVDFYTTSLTLRCAKKCVLSNKTPPASSRGGSM